MIAFQYTAWFVFFQNKKVQSATFPDKKRVAHRPMAEMVIHVHHSLATYLHLCIMSSIN